jgi:hypothetical protein
MRKIVLAAIAAFVPLSFAGPAKHVYLDRPGALEALEAENPAHYRQALELIRVAGKMPCRMVPKATPSKVDPADFHCAPTLLMTSFPPKRLIGFTLDDTRYIAIVTITDAGARLMPVK